MNTNLTEIVIIIDKSGSMGHLSNDVVGGINTFIQEQKKLEGDVNLSMILFDGNIEHKYDRIKLSEVNELTSSEYRPCGSTSLYDAIGFATSHIGSKLNDAPENDRPSKVLFAIMTDGEDNTSKEYTAQKIKEIIDHQTSKYSWEFLFMAANIDVDATAKSIGIANTLAFTADSVGTRCLYDSLNSYTVNYRSSK